MHKREFRGCRFNSYWAYLNIAQSILELVKIMAKKFFPKLPPTPAEQVKLFDESQGRLSELAICLLKLSPVDSDMYDIVKQLAFIGTDIQRRGVVAKVAPLQKEKDDNTKRLAQEENNVDLSIGGLAPNGK